MRADDRRRLAGLIAPLLGVAAFAGCSDDTDPVLDQRPASVEGRELEVRVPSAEILFTVGEPVDSVEGEEAPDDHAIVPVSWTVTRQPAGPFAGFDGQTEVDVVAGDETIELTTIDDQGGSDEAAYVVVPGDGADIDLQVTYDGVAQTVSTEGEPDHDAAAPYYAATGAGVDIPCGPDVWGLEGAVIECSARGWVLPYVPEQGWAPDGSVFVVVEPRVALHRVVDGRERYATTFAADRSTIDGVEPQSRLDPGTAGAGSADGVLVASVPADAAHVWEADLEFEITEGPRSGSRVRLAADLPVG